jgi:hypothetical protein
LVDSCNSDKEDRMVSAGTLPPSVVQETVPPTVMQKQSVDSTQTRHRQAVP